MLRVLLGPSGAGADSGLPVRRLAQAVACDELQLIARLAPEGPLRRHALVEVDAEAELGFLRPSDALQAARGLALWCRGALDEAGLLAAQLPGLGLLPTPPPETAWAAELRAEKPPAALLELVRERLVAPHPVLLALSGCSPEAALALAQAARLRLQRPVLVLDGAALQGWPLPQLVPALRRLRRDADLRGAALVISEAPLLGAAVRALCAPRSVGQTAPVVLCGSGSVALPAVPALVTAGEVALVPTTAALRAPAPASPAPTGAAAGTATGAAAAEPEDPAVLASREEARRRAALDAARAMGRPIPADLLGAVSAPAVPAAAAPVRPAPSPTPSPTPPPAAAAPAEPSRPAPAAAPVSSEAPAGRPRNPRLAAALAKAGLPPVGSAAHASLRAGDEPPDEPPPPRAAPPPAPEPVRPVSAAAPAAPSAAPEAAPAVDESADEQPPIPLEDDAPFDEVLRVARTTPNPTQRIALLRRLEGAKSPAVIQLFRQFITNAHPGVRAAAEAGMSSLFGPNWNRARAIAPPVQPPRSDDGGRGPGGAF
ncbi:MAG: hypothetical protein U1A78_09410 [Polyangia bacterium]